MSRPYLYLRIDALLVASLLCWALALACFGYLCWLHSQLAAMVYLGCVGSLAWLLRQINAALDRL